MNALEVLIKVLKLVSLNKKGDVIVTKTKIIIYTYKTKFLLMNFLTNTLRH